ncbi:MAG: hypothetical protein JWQ54_1088 [Mucilaginibacter sp.]|nr:hypothetical protein [Mucilaginibacter sp.]
MPWFYSNIQSFNVRKISPFSFGACCPFTKVYLDLRLIAHIHALHTTKKPDVYPAHFNFRGIIANNSHSCNAGFLSDQFFQFSNLEPAFKIAKDRGKNAFSGCGIIPLIVFISIAMFYSFYTIKNNINIMKLLLFI